MKDLIDKIDDLADLIEKVFLGYDGNNEEGFKRLIEADDLSPDMKETLILLHSKYTADMESIRMNTFRLNSKLIRLFSEALIKLKTQDDILESKIDTGKGKKRFTFTGLLFFFTSMVIIVGSIGVVMYFFSNDKEAAELLLRLIETSIKKI